MRSVQDYGGGGGGGYDANAQWQSRSIPAETPEILQEELNPIITSITPTIRYNNVLNGKKPFSTLKTLNDEIIKVNNEDNSRSKSRKKRGVLDLLQNAYIYWASKLLGYNLNTRPNSVPNHRQYKIVNGVKYVYYPMKYLTKHKSPKAVQPTTVTATNDIAKPIITADDFNKGEIMEGGFQSRMQRKKYKKLKDTLDEVLEDSPWQ